MIKALLPKCNLKVAFIDLIDQEEVGRYDPKADIILIDRSFKKEYPQLALLVLIHELMHSTITESRTLRCNRLVHKFGAFAPDSKSLRTEECIVELAAMVIAKKLGLLTPYSSTAFTHGLTKYYTKDMYIPWNEVVAAVTHYANDEEDFFGPLNYVRAMVKYRHQIDIRDSYDADRTPIFTD